MFIAETEVYIKLVVYGFDLTRSTSAFALAATTDLLYQIKYD